MAGAPLTVVPFVNLVLLYAFYMNKERVVNLFSVIVYLIMGALVVFNILVYGDYFNFEYGSLGTVILFLYSAFIITFTVFNNPSNDCSRELMNGFKYLSVVLFIFVLVQFISSNIFNDYRLISLLKDFSYGSYIRTDNEVLASYNTVRPPGFYLEPSYLGLVCFFLIANLALLGCNAKVFYILLLITVFLSGSATAIVICTMFLGLLLFYSSKSKLLKSVIFCFYFFVVMVVISMVSIRLQELLLPGTSGYYRYTAPLIMSFHVLVNNPIGIPLGTINDFVLSFNFLNGNTIGSSIDNGFFTLIIYFGFLALLFYGFLAMKIVKFSVGGNHLGVYLLTFCFLSLFFHGGIFLPDFAFMQFISIYCYKVIRFEVNNCHSQL
ncbi:hypothetical protein [Vibrio jasicida]|uniref:hypothetical protein n=1 Tax=Vibrio jasicida TaxID=766224 RepID=UPI004067BFD0